MPSAKLKQNCITERNTIGHTKSNHICTFHDPDPPARLGEHPAITNKKQSLDKLIGEVSGMHQIFMVFLTTEL